jgi:phage terminase large subunit-like protein
LGRQELDGLILEDVPGALWTDDMIDSARVGRAPLLRRVVVAIDPPVSHGEAANLCGIIVAGVNPEDHFYVLADRSCQGLRPHQWMRRALSAYQEFEADRLVAEVNQGGDLIEALLRQEAPHVAYRAVRASRGKITRAEPVAALYERGLVHHVGCHKSLEAQLRSYTGDAVDGSPDRLDALVWAISDLAQGLGMNPRVRIL